MMRQRPPLLILYSSSLVLCKGQRDFETGVSWLGLDADPPVVFEYDNVVRNMQTEPGALPDRFGRKEGVENVLLNLGWNTGPIIANFDAEMIRLAIGPHGQTPVAFLASIRV